MPVATWGIWGELDVGWSCAPPRPPPAGSETRAVVPSEKFLRRASCSSDCYKEAQVTVQVPALMAAVVGGHVEAARLLLERGAKADGESGAMARRAARGNKEIVALLHEHGATLTLHEECRDGNVAAITALLDGGADIEASTASSTASCTVSYAAGFSAASCAAGCTARCAAGWRISRWFTRRPRMPYVMAATRSLLFPVHS